jgi:multidrug efflux system outer membrane protein
VKRLALAFVLGGCISLAPTYHRPKAPIPSALPGGAGSASAANLPWQQFVKDPGLRRIIAQALANNRDLRKAVIDIDVARAKYRIQRAAGVPSIDANAAVSSSRSIFGTNTFQATLYQATVGLSGWEIDLFGRLKNLNTAQLEAYFSTVETARAARISLIAETATAYATLAADRSRLAIAQDTMASAQRTMDLTNHLVTGGVSNRADYWQATTVYQQARADVALLTATIAQDRDALELLAGGPVAEDALPAALPEQLDWFEDVPVGLSSSVLLERPDVLAAEHDLKAANADIGAARAAFFPSLSLTTDGGLASTALSALFKAPTAIWTIAPNLVIPLFHGGANRANLAAARAQDKALVAAYEGAVQRAFKEVSDALATRATIVEQLSAQASLVEAASKGLELAQARYQAGIDPFLNTLVAQRELYAAKSSLVATRLSALANRITLSRVLGGGTQ